MRSTSTIVAAATVATIMAFTAGNADAYSRTGGGTGPRGKSYTSHGSGSCSGGSCRSSQSVTGPRGGSAVRNNSGSCSGGACRTSHTGTGPGGRSYTRGNTFTR